MSAYKAMLGHGAVKLWNNNSVQLMYHILYSLKYFSVMLE